MILEPINQTKLFGYSSNLNELSKLYNLGKLPSKLLFSGQKGIGKCTLAYHLINYVLSLNEANPYDIKNYSINKDNKSFILIQNETNPNFTLIDVKDEKKNIDINQIRNLILNINKSSFNNKPRFVLIDNIEYLNLNSINALLKFLEEPNKNIFFILIHNNSKILSTLKSRCLSYKLFLSHKDSIEIIEKLLETNIENKINLNLINYYFSPGNILRLINFFDKTDFILKDLNLKELLELFVEEKIYKKNDSLNFIIYDFIEFYLISKFLSIKNNSYYYFINQINKVKKFNLDEESFFIEFKSKILNG